MAVDHPVTCYQSKLMSWFRLMEESMISLLLVGGLEYEDL